MKIIIVITIGKTAHSAALPVFIFFSLYDGVVHGAVAVDAKFSMPWRPWTPKIQTPGFLNARKINLNGSPASTSIIN